MASFYEFKSSIAAWVVLAMITCVASSMIVVLPLLRSSHPVLLHGIINPRYGAVPLDRSSDGMEERDQMEEGGRLAAEEMTILLTPMQTRCKSCAD